MRSSSHKSSTKRICCSDQAEDSKHDSGSGSAALFIVGIGPGDQAHMSGAAVNAIERSEVICGYATYVDLIRPLIGNRTVISTGMTKEVDRVWRAVETVRKGRTCTLVCSGDPGIYAMAGLVFQICAQNAIALGSGTGEIPVRVVPGIPALCAGAALLGAPLMHDFCAISLSDLLTPWEMIEKRLHAAGSADFVTVLYNPKSKKRSWQLDSAKKILLEYRDPETPVGLVTSAMRENENIELTTLQALDTARVGMQTTVFTGNSKTFVYGNNMVTPRGYEGKYELETEK
ncbi:MAG: precorrin-3B C(17)-methyltransferase [Desulfosalsimonas sp.]